MVATGFSRGAVKIAMALRPERLVCSVPAVRGDDGHGDRRIAGSHDHDLAQTTTPEDFCDSLPAAEGSVQLPSGHVEALREPEGGDFGILVMDLDESDALLPQRNQISGPHTERCPAPARRFHHRSAPMAAGSRGRAAVDGDRESRDCAVARGSSLLSRESGVAPLRTAPNHGRMPVSAPTRRRGRRPTPSRRRHRPPR